MVAADVLCVARRFVETGVTSFGPTMVSSSSAIYRRAMVAISKAREAQRIHCSVSSRRMEDEARDDGLGANILGMHLEGPYFASTKRVLMIRVTSFAVGGSGISFRPLLPR